MSNDQPVFGKTSALDLVNGPFMNRLRAYHATLGSPDLPEEYSTWPQDVVAGAVRDLITMSAEQLPDAQARIPQCAGMIAIYLEPMTREGAWKGGLLGMDIRIGFTGTLPAMDAGNPTGNFEGNLLTDEIIHMAVINLQKTIANHGCVLPSSLIAVGMGLSCRRTLLNMGIVQASVDAAGMPVIIDSDREKVDMTIQMFVSGLPSIVPTSLVI